MRVSARQASFAQAQNSALKIEINAQRIPVDASQVLDKNTIKAHADVCVLLFLMMMK